MDAVAGGMEVVVEAAAGIAVEASVRPEWSWGRPRKRKRCIGCEGAGVGVTVYIGGGGFMMGWRGFASCGVELVKHRF